MCWKLLYVTIHVDSCIHDSFKKIIRVDFLQVTPFYVAHMSNQVTTPIQFAYFTLANQIHENCKLDIVLHKCCFDVTTHEQHGETRHHTVLCFFCHVTTHLFHGENYYKLFYDCFILIFTQCRGREPTVPLRPLP